jgi:hypothetical protein
MSKLGQTAIENMAKIKVLDKESQEIRDATEKKTYHLRYDIYQKKIRALEAKRDSEVTAIQEQEKAAEDVRHAEVVELNKPVLKLKRILDYLRLDKDKNLTIADDDIEFSGYHTEYYKESLGYYLDDTYLKIKLFILQNDKPTNKYGLAAAGRCLFYQEILNLPRHYIPCAHVKGSSYSELELVIRDFPTIAAAKEWLKKNRARLFPDDFMFKYLEVKTDYQQTLRDYKVSDFEEFLLARCVCGNFHTVWEDYILREKIVTCNRCNKTMTLTANHIEVQR